MRIEQAAVAMDARHEFSGEYEYAVVSTLSFRSVLAGASAQAEVQAEAEAGAAGADAAQKAGDVSPSRSGEQQRLALLIAQIVGRLLDFLVRAGESAESTDSAPAAGGSVAALTAGDAIPVPGIAHGFGASRPRIAIDWSHVASERIEEHERSDFSSTGKIATADGRTVEFTLGLSMCRDFSCLRTSVEAGTVELRDPLVINFSGNAAELDGQCFAFDLDADGRDENVHALAQGSGYLAIDRNSDGRINDGSELFGTSSGDGFADLAMLDADGNRWLDESDAAFATLRVWRRDAAGQSSLATLRDAGVGALYLGAQATPFALTDGDNRLLGQVRASGIYLNEDGSAGTLQQIDLAV